MKIIQLVVMLFLVASPTYAFGKEAKWEKPNFVLEEAKVKKSKFTFGGSVRLRYENKDEFNFSKGNEDYGLSQIRLNVTYTPVDWLSIFVEGQDSRIYGEENINEKSTPNSFRDDAEFHQGYFDFKHSIKDIPFKLRIGRQKFDIGSTRLIGSAKWGNTARVWDAVRLTVGEKKKRIIEAISSRLVPVDPDSFNDWANTKNRMFNSDFHVLYYTDWLLVPLTQFELYGMFRHENDVDDSVYTMGSRFETKYGNIDVDGEIAGQVGEYGDVDHRAYMAHIGSGYTLKKLKNTRLGVAYNFGSGDDNPNDQLHETFDNLYPRNHRYYGFMDFVSLKNIHNFEAAVKAKIFKPVSLRLAYQMFWLAEEDDDAWYNAGTAPIRNAKGQDVDSHVGNEVDITLNYTKNMEHFINKVVFEVNYSHFFTGDYIEDTGPDNDADFLYVVTKIFFKH